MKLSDLIEDLQELATVHGKDVDVEFTIPAHEGSYESDYSASELAESELVKYTTWKNKLESILHLTLQ